MKLRELEIGSVVKDSAKNLTFLVAAQNHPGYGGTTLLAQKIVDLGCFDAAEPESRKEGNWRQACFYGYNDYAKSNVHQWLNAQGTGWYQPSHETDTPPEMSYTRYREVAYESRPGFLTGFSGIFQEALLEVGVPYLKCIRRDQGELGFVKAKVFLPSRTELGKGDEHGIAEGMMFPLAYDSTSFKTTLTEERLDFYGRKINPQRDSAPYDAAQIYDPKWGWWYWIRTANMGYDFLNRVASTYGALSYTYSNNDSVGIRPVLNLDGELEVESNRKFMEIFTLKG